jgi:hypothetical protein
MTGYRYRPEVLAELWRHGVQPRETTPPELVRGYVNDLYRYELRKLRDQLLVGEIPKAAYHDVVVHTRNRYRVLALKARQWLVSQEPLERGT